MKLPVVLREDENGYVVAQCPVFTGCQSEGKTEKEALGKLKREIIQNLITAEDIESHITEKVTIKEIYI